MMRTGATRVHTYVPTEAQDAQILDFAQALEAVGREAPVHRPALVSASGERVEIPEAMFDVLQQVQKRWGVGWASRLRP